MIASLALLELEATFLQAQQEEITAKKANHNVDAQRVINHRHLPSMAGGVQERTKQGSISGSLVTAVEAWSATLSEQFTKYETACRAIPCDAKKNIFPGKNV